MAATAAVAALVEKSRFTTLLDGLPAFAPGPRRMRRLLRQGDVLLVEIGAFPQGTRRVAGAAGAMGAPPIVLASGDAGPCHAIEDGHVTALERDGRTYLRVPREATLRHEAHPPLPIPPGTYEVRCRGEFLPGAVAASPLRSPPGR